MTHWLKNIFSKKQKPAGLGELPIVWDSSRLSIYQFLLNKDPEDIESLPDDAEWNQHSEMKWASGALDGVISHHGALDNIDKAGEVLDLIYQAVKNPSKQHIQCLYNLLKDGAILEFIDPLIEKLSEYENFPHQNLQQLVYWLATESPDRALVKFAIAILGIYPEPKQTELLMTFGAHEEFTLFAVVALRNSLPPEEIEASLLLLAKKLTGWGKIHTVEILAQNPSIETQKWLLRKGYQNSIMYEYLAYTCATAGELLAALTPEKIDHPLLLSTGEIIEALICGGPAEDMSNYADGALVCSRYLDHLLQQSELTDLAIYNTVASIRDYLETQDNAASDTSDQTWDNALREKIKTQADQILNKTHWLTLAEQGLTEVDEGKFWKATIVYKHLGKDIWPIYYERQKVQKNNQWYFLTQTDDPERIKQVIALAKEQYDFAKIATGPTLELGIGPDFKIHGILDTIVQNLNRFPGIGGDLILLGLQNPTIRNRNMALKALESWEKTFWPENAIQVLNKALRDEPDIDVKKRLQAILS